MIPSWLRSWFGKSTPVRKTANRPARFTPSVFALEDRLVPTTVAAATEAALLAAFAATPANGVVDFAPGLAGGTIDLATQNPGASGSFFVFNKNLTIDASALGAAGITLNRAGAAPAFRIFEVGSGFTVNFVNLTITNGSATDGGAILVSGGTSSVTNCTFLGNTASGVGGAIAVTSGSVQFDGVTIGAAGAGNPNTAVRGGGIAVANAATISFVNNVTNVQFNTATTTGGGIDFGASFSNTLAFNNNLRVTSNSTTASGSHGGGIAMRGSGAVTLNNVTVSSNHANGTGSSGGGLYVSGGALNANGTTTIGTAGNPNTAAGNGAGVHVDGGTFTLASTATIASNVASNLGGGLFQSDGVANINGTISNNQAASNGGGAFVIGGTFNFNAGASITGNSSGANGGGIVVSSVGVATLRGTISNNTAATAGGGLFVAGGSTTLNGVAIGGPTAADGNDAANGGGIAVSAGTLTFSTAATTVRFNTATANGGGVALLNGFTGTVNAAALLSVLDNTITAANGHGAGIAVLGNSSLTMTGGTIVRNSFVLPTATGGTGGGIYQNDGSVTLDGVTIGGSAPNANFATGNGAGVHVDGGTFTLASTATIASNVASNLGGGLFQSNGIANINGTISNNQATSNGGGAFVIGGTFNFNAGASITGNNSGANGGGMVVSSVGVATLSGTISNNTAATSGGGLFVGGGSATLNGVTIGGPTAADGNDAANGGGIAVSAGTLTFSTAVTTVRFNSATASGGGVALLNGFTGTVNAAALLSVLDNTITAANGHGAGIAVLGNSSLTLTGGAIVRNSFVLPTATGGTGGGIYQNGGSVTLDGVTIGGSVPNANSATGSGGGIHVAAGNLTFSGVTSAVGNNTAPTGAGLHFAGGTLSVTGTQFSNNVATGDGGGLLLAGTTHNFTNATVNGNQAGGAGGGIRQTAGTTNYNSALISGNTAAGDGGGASIAGGTFNIASGVQITGNTSTGGNGGGLAYTGGSGHQINGVSPTPMVVVASNTANNSLGTAGKGQGGGIYINLAAGNGMSLTGLLVGGANATVDRNQSLASGGGIAIAGGGTISLTNSTIQNNSTAGTGGGINVGGTFNGTLDMDPMVITGNTSAGDGGGMNISMGTVIFGAGDQIFGNVSTGGNGGGLAYTGGMGHQINGTLANPVAVFNNTALNTLGNANKGFGGGIFFGLGAGVAFTQITFLQVGGPTALTDRNSALSGGGIAVATGGVITVTSTTIQNNQATTGTGGGINIASSYTGTFTTDPTIIDSNIAAGDGGGVNVLGGTFVVSAGDEITRNTSTGGSGGGINYGGGNNHTITSAIIAGNTATVGNGGGVNLNPGLGAGLVNITTTAIGGNTITSGAGTTGGNTAGANGGGINTFAGNLTLVGNTIGGLAAQTGNTAGNSGGGVCVNGGIVSINGGAIGDIAGAALAQGNSAGTGGGVEFAAGTLTFVVAPTLIQFNQATTNGGGLDITAGGNLTVNNGTLFSSNAAGTSGGGVAHRGNGTLVLSATVQANTATANGGGIFLTGGMAVTGVLTYSGTLGGALTAQGNTAGSFGGGLFVQNGSFGITASSILNNVATANDGGGVFVSGAGPVNTIANSTINLNRAPAGAGGGVHVAGGFSGSLNLNTLTIGGPVVGTDGNIAGTTGGGVNIAAVAGIVNLNLSTVANNTATTNGGGIAISAGALGMNNDTVTLNTAGAQGGGIFVTGAGANAVLVAVTVARNTATTATGGIRHNAGTLSVFNVISALNTGPGAGTDITTVGAGFTDGGFNLFQTNSGFALAGTDVPDPARQTPLLAALGNYGGPTFTIALLPGSPAINAGNNLAGPTDQRGQAIAGGTRDIGAFESQGFNVALNPPTSQSTIVNTAFAFPLAVTVTPKNAGEPVAGGVVTFTAGTVAGATATIAGNVAAINGAGVATTGTVTANGTFGTYPVAISTAGFFNPPPPPLPTFTLTNLGIADVSFLPGKTGQQPTNTISGQVINNTIDGVIAVILDQNGNPLPLAGISVSVTVNTGPGALVPTATVSILTDAAGRAFYSPNIHAPNPAAAPLVINTTGTYTLRATVATNANPPGVANTISTPFNITAAKILFAAGDIPDKVRSGAPFTVTGAAVGVDNSVDPNFNENVTLGFDTTTLPAGTFNPNPQPTVMAAAGLITFNNVTLGKGGLFQLMATAQVTLITGSDPGTTKVTAATTAITQATSAAIPAQPSQGPGQSGNLRSSNQTSIVDPNYDNLLVTVTGFDIEGNPTDIDGNVQLTLNVGVQDRSGVPTPVVGSFQGVTSINRPAAAGAGNSAANTNIQFTAAANHLTIDRWGDYTINSAATGAGLNSINVSGVITVIGRQIFVVNPPALVVGTFTVRTEARDVTGDIAQNYTPPFAYADGRPSLGPDGSDPTVLTITDLSQRLQPGQIVGLNGTTVTQQGSSVVATATPFRGVTTYTFKSNVPVLVTLNAVDQKMLFIGSQGSIEITTLQPGRRRPRPIDPVLNPRVRQVRNVLGVQFFL